MKIDSPAKEKATGDSFGDSTGKTYYFIKMHSSHAVHCKTHTRHVDKASMLFFDDLASARSKTQLVNENSFGAGAVYIPGQQEAFKSQVFR